MIFFPDNFQIGYLKNTMVLNKEAMKILLLQNSDTIKSYVQLLFDLLKNEIESVKRENAEIKRNLEFTQSELREAQTTIGKQRRLIEDSNDGATTEIRERLRELGRLFKTKQLDFGRHSGA